MSEETILFKGSSSMVINLGAFVLSGLIVVAAAAVGLAFPRLPVVIGALVFGGAALVYGLVQWLLIKVRVYEITNERVRISTGILTRRTDELELYRVKDATLIEPLLLRIFGVGNIDMTTNDASTPGVKLEAIDNARDLREELRKNIEICREAKRVRLAELE